MDNHGRAQLAEKITRTVAITVLRGNINSVVEKGGVDFVTSLDFAVEQQMIEMLKAADQDTLILGEESWKQELLDLVQDGRPAWILDPIDGTTNMMNGLHYNHLMTYVDGGLPQVAVVYVPLMNEMFVAIRNGGAWLNREKLPSISNINLSKGKILYGGVGYTTGIERIQFAQEVFSAADFLPGASVRVSGCSGLELCHVATGRAIGYMERKQNVYDKIHGPLFMQEVGGKFTDFQGNEPSFYEHTPLDIVAAPPQIHEKIIESLR